MKVTLRKATKAEATSAQHVDRSFLRNPDRRDDPGFAAHIDRARMSENHVYLNPEIKRLLHELREQGPATLADAELAYYRQRFSASLEAKNQHYRRKGSRDKVRTMEEYYSNDRTKPEEFIFQLGDRGEHPEQIDGELKKAVKILRDHGLHVLDAYIHHDETTPHAHIRGVFIAHDSRGYEEVCQSGALRELGVERPDLDKPQGRDNCPLMAWTEQVRTEIESMCISMGHNIDLERAPRRDHMTVEEYKDYAYQQEIAAIDAELQQERQQYRSQRKRLQMGVKDRDGKRLAVKQIQALEDKRILSREDRRDLIYTALESASAARAAVHWKDRYDMIAEELAIEQVRSQDLRTQLDGSIAREHYDAVIKEKHKLQQRIAALRETLQQNDIELPRTEPRPQLEEERHRLRLD